MHSRICYDIPYAGLNERIGLLGGSFDPAHEGHRLISLHLMRRLQLDWLWWLVSPGNPLKHQPHQDLQARLEKASQVASHPRIIVTALEANYKTRYTADTIRLLKTRRPDLQFIWLMGADNAAQFHHWQEWKFIADAMPIAIYDRPGWRYQGLASQFGHAFEKSRNTTSRRKLVKTSGPEWAFMNGPLSPQSSTLIRQNQKL